MRIKLVFNFSYEKVTICRLSEGSALLVSYFISINDRESAVRLEIKIKKKYVEFGVGVHKK